MAVKKRKAGRHRRRPSHKPQHIDEYSSAEQISEEEGAANDQNEPARQHGKYRHKRNQRMKGNNVPECKAGNMSDMGTSENDEQPEEDLPLRIYTRGGGRVKKMKKKKSRKRYHYTVDKDNEEEGEEDNLEYHTAKEGESSEHDEFSSDSEDNFESEDSPILPGYLFEEHITQESEDEARDQEIESQLKVQVIMRYLDEMRKRTDGSEIGNMDDSGRAFNPDYEQERRGLGDSSSTGGIEPDEERNGSQFFQHSISEASTYDQRNERFPGSEENDQNDRADHGAPCLDGLHKETTHADSTGLVNPGFNDSTAEVEQSGGDERTNASPVSRSSTWKSGLVFLTKTIWGFPKLLSRKDEEGTNVQLPAPRNLRGHLGEGPSNIHRHYWLIKMGQKLESSNGYTYEGEIADQKMHGHGRLMLSNEDLIAGNWNANRLVDLKFCQLHYREKTFHIVKRFDDYLLTICENHFAATVTLNSTDHLNFNTSIGLLKEAFFGQLTTLEVLQDELQLKKQVSIEHFESLLNTLTGENADPIKRANVFILLRKYSTNNVFNTKISYFLRDVNVPSELKNAAINVLSHDDEYRRLHNSFIFLRRAVQLDLTKIMAKIYTERIKNHREKLISKCPSALPSLKSELQNLDDLKIVYVTRADIEVFDQLASHPFSQHYHECLENLVKRFGQTFDKISADTHPSTAMPIMSPVFEFLVRSLWEIISEIVEVVDDCEYESMLKCESGNWIKKQKIKWPKEENGNEEQGVLSFFRSYENKTSLYHRALEVQYKHILGMLKQIFPDNYIMHKKFNYRFCVLEQDLSGDRRVEHWWPNTRISRGLPERFKKLSEERLAWLFLLDHTIHEVFKNDPKYPDVLKRYDPLIQGQVRFIETSPSESHESFRALTHNVVKLVTSSAPYIKVTTEKLDVDVEILFQQISTASHNIDHDPLAFSNFRDLITEYNRYLSLRHFIEIEAAPGYFSSQLSQMMQTFMRIVGNSLKKSVPTNALVVYFRCLNDFLDDFRNIDFLSMWYIKTLGHEDPEAIEKIDNKLSSGKNCSYRVTNIEKFVSEYQLLDIPPHHHYIIQIVDELLGCIEKCLDKQWESGDGQLQLEQLKTTGVLLEAVRRSFMYLKEQPDYVDFRAFKKESVEPFIRLVEDCSTSRDLKTRADIVKESFWYLRKMDEIGIDQALALLNDLNTCHDSEKLSNCYNLYLEKYNKYIETYTSLLSDGKCHSQGLNAVKRMLKQADPIHFSQWTEEFKTKEIPILLAGLSAIWSILVSKDLSSTGKFLKPHCIQILCILRLLSVGQAEGTDNHLAQVLTGQGKSVILGLLSSILALTGHNVRVMCYSRYLSSRDESDFWEFFRTFRITSRINYGTFKDMANDFLHPTLNGRKISLHQLLKDKVLNHTNWSTVGSVSTESANTVLLIDEVDVFFSENFYGNEYRTCEFVGLRGLCPVQEKIWSLASTKSFDERQIVDLTKAFIRDEAAAGNTMLSDLNAFLNRPGTFSLLEDEGGNLIVKEAYTNQTFFDEHLQEMVNDALLVATEADFRHVQFMIDSEGVILSREPDDMYINEWTTTIYGYLNTFMYFKLKISNYEHEDFQNYGYFLVTSGQISYSRLPSQFRLILGVSGTIKNLNKYEMSGIQSYNIHKTTILPSFYGESNLKFSKDADFHYCIDEEEWLKKIYDQANKIVQSSRAVLIFFETDLKMELFTEEYRTKFDRLNEITVDTLPNRRDACIDEAGLTGAVTLATRTMGRGVDYKSSLSVEKHGGVHVIQTFYSTDIKEEIQIKGRTARKDNKGSYEIVICKKHLITEHIITQQDETPHNYATLDEIRQKLSDEKGKTVTEKIEKSERRHKLTMEYFGLA